MSMNKLIPTTILLFFVFLLAVPSYVSADHVRIPETDTGAASLFSFFDLRERETYVQVTNTANPDFVEGQDTDNLNLSNDITFHVQIWYVVNDCTENNFFDTYTPHDTHVYNMRDIQTNNGTPSGVVLPDGAYGFISVVLLDSESDIARTTNVLVGNFRILDATGYEYRTNSSGWDNVGVAGSSCQPIGDDDDDDEPGRIYTFNFNTKGGVSFSDIVVISVNDLGSEFLDNNDGIEVSILEAWHLFDVDIVDLNENVFSCRNVIFGCVDQNNPLLEALFEEVEDHTDSSASVASFEYGINNAIPHSRGGELLCPGNNISEGFVRLERFDAGDDDDDDFDEGSMTAHFVGLNNGNGRGSMDFWWTDICEEVLNPPVQ